MVFFSFSQQQITIIIIMAYVTKGSVVVSASFRVVFGDFGCDVTCQACRESSRYRARFQVSSDQAGPEFGPLARVKARVWPEYGKSW